MEGLAEHLELPPGTLLYHGTMAKEFTSNEPYLYQVKSTPNGPAWFANDPIFSLHVAARFTKAGKKGSVQLHTYKTRGKIIMSSFKDFITFKSVLKEQGVLPPGKEAELNGTLEGVAMGLVALDTPVGGYAVLEDLVRGEPEYVLFPGSNGLGLLTLVKTEEVFFEPATNTKSVLALFDGGKIVRKFQYTYDGGLGDLKEG